MAYAISLDWNIEKTFIKFDISSVEFDQMQWQSFLRNRKNKLSTEDYLFGIFRLKFQKHIVIFGIGTF